MELKNYIAEGKLKGGGVKFFTKKKGLELYKGFKTFYANRETIERYEVIDESSHKSMASGIVRGAVGGAIGGVVGAAAGAASAKSKSIYKVALYFTDGEKSLVVIDDFIYGQLVEMMF